MRTVLFVCSGNTCRSPMAEAIARHWTSRGLIDGEDLFVASAGTSAMEGVPVSPQTIRAVSRWDIEHGGSSKRLTADMIRRADAVLCMTDAHRAACLDLVQNDADGARHIELLNPAGDIDDPIGLAQSAYDELAEHLMDLIPRRLKELLADENRNRSGSSRD